MLSPSEYDYLLGKLEIAMAVPGRNFLAGLPPACAKKIGDIKVIRALATATLNACQADGRNSIPMWLVLLIQLLPDEPLTAEIKNRLLTAPIPAQPELARILVSDTPFLNRTELRRTAISLGELRPLRPILVVSGDTKSGKSYTMEYIDHLSFSGRPFAPFRIKFPTGSGLTYGPVELARDMLVGMGVAPDRLSPSFFQNTTNNERWPYDLAGRVLAEGHQLGRRFWIVLDAFTGLDLQKETSKFIDGLAQRIVDSAIFNESYRLILLDFERALLSIEPRKVDFEQINPPGIADVLDFISEIVNRLSDPATVDLPKLVAGVMAGLPNDEKRLPELNARLLDLMKQLR